MSSDFSGDKNTFVSRGQDYYPHIYPRFSWTHLKKLAPTTQVTPRAGGQFYWNKIRSAVDSQAGSLFVGMFDECDEGTAIAPMSDDPPNSPSGWGQFVTNEGKPSHWWMMLTGEAHDILTRARPNGQPLPGVDQLLRKYGSSCCGTLTSNTSLTRNARLTSSYDAQK